MGSLGMYVFCSDEIHDLQDQNRVIMGFFQQSDLLRLLTISTISHLGSMDSLGRSDKNSKHLRKLMQNLCEINQCICQQCSHRLGMPHRSNLETAGALFAGLM